MTTVTLQLRAACCQGEQQSDEAVPQSSGSRDGFASLAMTRAARTCVPAYANGSRRVGVQSQVGEQAGWKKLSQNSTNFPYLPLRRHVGDSTARC